ncbi:hypothetical protein [Sorangium sp. So ce131]|uniref:hypothetical protein n=1 Tax=Sorangium sp. So ce131 TaxID=3133282 RepID=UPI003F61BA06
MNLVAHRLLAALSSAASLLLLSCSDVEAAPPSSSFNPPVPGAAVVVAINELFVGETDAPPWRSLGFNLDGKISTAASEDLCKPVDGGQPNLVFPDGDNGIDNSFGKHLLPLIKFFSATPSKDVTDGIQKRGHATLLMSIEGLGPEASYRPLVTKLYAGAQITPAPRWDGRDEWPVVPQPRADRDEGDRSVTRFPESYVDDNTWFSGDMDGAGGTIQLHLNVFGENLALTIRAARMTAELDADHKSARKGVIGGVIETEALVEEVRFLISRVAPRYCGDVAIEALVKQIRAASDIMKDGTQDHDKVCDGISVGLGFNARQVQIGGTAPSAAPRSGTCP